jgi:hypothetical protein
MLLLPRKGTVNGGRCWSINSAASVVVPFLIEALAFGDARTNAVKR